MNETTTRQWFAGYLRSLAARLDGKTPTLDEIRESMLYDAEVALLNADAEAVRAAHTANMLRERLDRLRR